MLMPKVLRARFWRFMSPLRHKAIMPFIFETLAECGRFGMFTKSTHPQPEECLIVACFNAAYRPLGMLKKVW
jgi:hypothetical protein